MTHHLCQFFEVMSQNVFVYDSTLSSVFFPIKLCVFTLLIWLSCDFLQVYPVCDLFSVKFVKVVKKEIYLRKGDANNQILTNCTERGNWMRGPFWRKGRLCLLAQLCGWPVRYSARSKLVPMYSLSLALWCCQNGCMQKQDSWQEKILEGWWQKARLHSKPGCFRQRSYNFFVNMLIKLSVIQILLFITHNELLLYLLHFRRANTCEATLHLQ